MMQNAPAIQGVIPWMEQSLWLCIEKEFENNCVPSKPLTAYNQSGKTMVDENKIRIAY